MAETSQFDFEASKNSLWIICDWKEFIQLIRTKDFELRDAPVLYQNYRFELHDSRYVAYFQQEGRNFEIVYYPAPGQGRDIKLILEKAE